MGREIIIAWVGRHRRSDWEKLCGHYRDGMQRWAVVKDLPIRSRSKRSGADRAADEGRDLVAALPPESWRVALDRRGRQRGSEDLARWLGHLMESRPHPLAFLLGSDLGLSKHVLQEADESLSLGPLTLPHELARLVLHEQIYRALSILAGIKYHRQPL